jgi:hypothetical protein
VDDFERELAATGAAAMEDDTTKPRPLVVTAAEFFAEQDEALTSLWGDGLLVPGGGYLIASSQGGVGKTIVLCGLFIALAAGKEEFLGFSLPGEPVPCLILEAEGSRKKFRERIASMARAYKLEATKLPLFFQARCAALSIAETLDPMLQKCGARVALLDSVGHFHDGDENLSTDWRREITKPLGEISRRRNAAIAFADHYVKPNEARQNRHKTRGSAAKVDDCGAAIRLEYGKGGKASRILFFDRVRDGGLPDPDRIALKMDVAAGHVALDADGCTDSAPQTAADERREQVRVNRSLKAQEKIENAIAMLEGRDDYDRGEGVSERRLSEAVGMSRNQEAFHDALRGLEAQKVIERAPGGGWRRKVR